MKPTSVRTAEANGINFSAFLFGGYITITYRS